MNTFKFIVGLLICSSMSLWTVFDCYRISPWIRHRHVTLKQCYLSAIKSCTCESAGINEIDDVAKCSHGNINTRACCKKIDDCLSPNLFLHGQSHGGIDKWVDRKPRGNRPRKPRRQLGSELANCDRPCTKDFAPVCGSDEVTYSNMCQLGIAQCKNDTITLAKNTSCSGELEVVDN